MWHTISNFPSFFFETELRSHPELRYSSVNKGSYSLWLNFLLPMEENYWSSSLGSLVRHKNFLLHFVRSNFSAVSKHEKQDSLFFVVLILVQWGVTWFFIIICACTLSLVFCFSSLSSEPGCVIPCQLPWRLLWTPSHMLMLVFSYIPDHSDSGVQTVLLRTFCGCQQRDFCIGSKGWHFWSHNNYNFGSSRYLKISTF